MSVLVYADDPVHPAPETYVDQALQRLGLSYTAHYVGDFGGFQNDLESGDWDLVIFADDNYFPDFSVLDSLNAYVSNGGVWSSTAGSSNSIRAIRSSRPSASGFQETSTRRTRVFWWQPDHPAFTFPELAPRPTQLDGFIYGIYGQRGDRSTAPRRSPATPPRGRTKAGALVLANEERTAFKGFLDGQNSADLDGDGVPDGVEIWENLAFGIGQGFFTDVPWLSGRRRPAPSRPARRPTSA
jgi:hypothetical protein